MSVGHFILVTALALVFTAIFGWFVLRPFMKWVGKRTWRLAGLYTFWSLFFSFGATTHALEGDTGWSIFEGAMSAFFAGYAIYYWYHTAKGNERIWQ